MFTVASVTTNPIEAHIIKGRLEVEGIPAIVLFENHIWAKWTLSNALGGVRVLVPQERQIIAQTIVANINAGYYEEALLLEHELSFIECPKCRSNNTANHYWLGKLALVSVLLAMITIPYTNHLYSCENCKHSWIAHNQRPYSLYAIFGAILIYSFSLHILYVVSAMVFSWRVWWL